MARLRRTQNILNGFWQTSELAYGYLLAASRTAFPDLDRPTFELLGHIETEVWYPNNQGRIKRSDTIGTTLKQMRDNTIHVYRATLLSFSSAFESYLDDEVTHLKRPGLRWGEYVRSLSHEQLRNGQRPLPLRTVLCADFCREIRNKMVHEGFSVPASLADADVAGWKRRLICRARAAGWAESEIVSEIPYAANQVIGQAVNHVKQASKQGKELPIELFYMLFTFTNLDSLAFAIEEALQPLGSRPGYRVSRNEDAVRRSDLVIGSAA